MSEHDEQVALINWARYHEQLFPGLDLLHAIPNGGKRNKIVAAKLKAEGVRAGIPDLMLPVARQGYHGLYIEMKAGRNKPTAKQLEKKVALEGQGYRVAVCWGWEAAAREIESYYSCERS